MTYLQKPETSHDHVLSAVIPSRFGKIIIYWVETPQAQLCRIFLPRDGKADYPHACTEFPGAAPSASDRRLPASIEHFMKIIDSVLSGTPVPAPAELLTECLQTLPPFQRRVLSLEATIPFGHISTYGELAAAAGSPSGARAVASALSHNPFPLLIPCHRVIASSGNLAGYQGGTSMKEQLLRQEGIPFTGGAVDISRANHWNFLL